jgi:hypothetical protein
MNTESWLRWLLRLLGSLTLLALLAIIMPGGWMDAVHRWLGLGPLPEGPIVGYLARSLSAFYALLGGLLWVLSFNVTRYQPVLVYLGAAILAFGFIMLGIDWREGLPPYWIAWECAVNLVYGGLILWLARRLPSRCGG